MQKYNFNKNAWVPITGSHHWSKDWNCISSQCKSNKFQRCCGTCRLVRALPAPPRHSRSPHQLAEICHLSTPIIVQEQLKSTHFHSDLRMGHHRLQTGDKGIRDAVSCLEGHDYAHLPPAPSNLPVRAALQGICFSLPEKTNKSPQTKRLRQLWLKPHTALVALHGLEWFVVQKNHRLKE